MKKLFLFLAVFLFLPAICFAEGNVIINEIAWMGTANSQNDEWIELFNNSDNTINLSSWALKTSDGKLKINLKGEILAKSFYLLERTDDNSVPNIKADLIYTGALVNSGMDLGLYDNLGNIIDQANFSSGWLMGDNTAKQTMERTKSLSWQTSSASGGTPKYENSIVIAKTKPQTSPLKTVLSKQEKSNNSSEVKLASAENSIPEKEPNNNSWILFLGGLAITLISGITILVLKLVKK